MCSTGQRWTANVIICYLPQQRTRGCTKSRRLVTAPKWICQLLPAAKATLTRPGEDSPEPGWQVSGEKESLQDSPDQCPRYPGLGLQKLFPLQQGPHSEAGPSLLHVPNRCPANSRVGQTRARSQVHSAGGPASGGPRAGCYLSPQTLRHRGCNPFPGTGHAAVSHLIPPATSF